MPSFLLLSGSNRWVSLKRYAVDSYKMVLNSPYKFRECGRRLIAHSILINGKHEDNMTSFGVEFIKLSFLTKKSKAKTCNLSRH